MDPDAALQRIRDLIAEINDEAEGSLRYLNLVSDLADAVQDLDEWLAKGGYLPAAWRAAGPTSATAGGIR